MDHWASISSPDRIVVIASSEKKTVPVRFDSSSSVLSGAPAGAVSEFFAGSVVSVCAKAGTAMIRASRLA
ncbi:MAG: hypothetical protein B7Z10_12800 [Rhodobacterales bacterium 32-66-7]|nr:MAG: hypothetical protein B7Z10_12800 [Rhodobacterales bacterium 32-66-7]